MAKKTLIIDDLTGETGARTRTLRFDGVEYEIDLTEKSFADLKRALRPYLRSARALTGTSSSVARASTARGRKAAAGASDSAAIRAWARSSGVAVTERGRVPAPVRVAWEAAGSPR